MRAERRAGRPTRRRWGRVSAPHSAWQSAMTRLREGRRPQRVWRVVGGRWQACYECTGRCADMYVLEPPCGRHRGGDVSERVERRPRPVPEVCPGGESCGGGVLRWASCRAGMAWPDMAWRRHDALKRIGGLPSVDVHEPRTHVPVGSGDQALLTDRRPLAGAGVAWRVATGHDARCPLPHPPWRLGS